MADLTVIISAFTNVFSSIGLQTLNKVLFNDYQFNYGFYFPK